MKTDSFLPPCVRDANFNKRVASKKLKKIIQTFERMNRQKKRMSCLSMEAAIPRLGGTYLENNRRCPLTDSSKVPPSYAKCPDTKVCVTRE